MAPLSRMSGDPTFFTTSMPPKALNMRNRNTVSNPSPACGRKEWHRYRVISYEFPKPKGEVLVKADGGKLISVKGGDFLVVDVFGAGGIGVQAIDLRHKERTYRRWDSSASA